jgi:serine O-acetyltransferase
MKRILKNIIVPFKYIRMLPLIPFIKIIRGNKKLNMDIERWCQILKKDSKYFESLTYLMCNHKEFRNLFIYRISENLILRIIAKIFFKPVESLFIETPCIGGGMFIQHGFATIICAQSIGENFWINQQVTIGHKDNKGCPVIGDNVMVTAGAKLIGPVIIGDNVTIGANAVVIKDVEENLIVAGVPAKLIGYNK